MSIDTRTYNYQDLNAFIDNLKNSTTQIDARIEELQKQATNLLQTWEGKTAAEGYSTEADKIQKNLHGENERLDRVKMAVSDGVEEFQRTDKSGVSVIVQ